MHMYHIGGEKKKNNQKETALKISGNNDRAKNRALWNPITDGEVLGDNW